MCGHNTEVWWPARNSKQACPSSLATRIVHSGPGGAGGGTGAVNSHGLMTSSETGCEWINVGGGGGAVAHGGGASIGAAIIGAAITPTAGGAGSIGGTGGGGTYVTGASGGAIMRMRARCC